MSISADKINQPNESDKTRRTVFIVAAVIALALIAGLIYYLKTRPETPQTAGPVDEKLQDGARAGSPDFDKNRDLIRVDEPVADYSSSVAGGLQMTLATTVRNFTGRTISGLEMKASLVDMDGKVIRERTKIAIPSGEITELENNKTARVPITITGFSKEDEKSKIEGGQAKLKMEVTAVKFK